MTQSNLRARPGIDLYSPLFNLKSQISNLKSPDRHLPLGVRNISFPDDPHQFYCRNTPLQTLTIPVIIETSSEH